MIGILLAGGTGSRLAPLTKVVNKHILPILDRPMIFYPLQTLVDSDIHEVIIVYGPPFGAQIKEIVKHFPDLKKIKLHFVNQDQPLGMAHGILLCQKLTQNQQVMVIAGDNIYGKDFKKDVTTFKKGALSFKRKVSDPQRFGVPIYDGKKLLEIKEKPAHPQTNWAVTGPHFFDQSVFEKIKTLKPSDRGELEVTELNNLYIKEGTLKLRSRNDLWLDAGTFESLFLASIKLRKLKI